MATVSPHAASPSSTSAAASREMPRPTATFTPYFWEAYNEIVQPRRFDHYLITKWLPSLGPTGFALLKALRDRCYHNPTTGMLRDSCEVDLTELGKAIGVSRATIVRELAGNEALGHFVRRVHQYRMVDGKPQKDRNAYQVSMDDPIHPDDLTAYDDLRAIKEAERAAAAARGNSSGNGKQTPTVIKGEDGSSRYKAQNEPNSKTAEKEPNSYKAQNEPNSPAYKAQNEPSDTKYLSDQNDPLDTKYLSDQNAPSIADHLPPGFLTKELLTPPAASGETPHISPQGEGDSEEDDTQVRLQIAWSLALPLLAKRLTKPTFKTHVETLIPQYLVEPVGEGNVEVVMGAPNAFTREWLEKRHQADFDAAVTQALGRPAHVRLTQILPAAQDKGATLS